MKKKIFMLLMAIMTLGSTAKAESYGLKIFNVEVTDENCGDLASAVKSKLSRCDGKIYYIPGLKTLVLEDLNIISGSAYSSGSVFIENDIDDLTIEVRGECYVGYLYTGSIYDVCSWGIWSKANFQIVGGTRDAHLQFKTFFGILLDNHDDGELTTLTVKTAVTLTTDSDCIYSQKDEVTQDYCGVLRVEGLLAKIECDGSGTCIDDLKMITFGDGIKVRYPEGAYVSGGNVVNEDGRIIFQGGIVIRHYESYYGLQVMGHVVTEENADDLAALAGISEGELRYDTKTKTLYMKDIMIGSRNYDGTALCNGFVDRAHQYTNPDDASTRGIDDLTIKVVGKCYIYSDDKALELNSANTTITGSGRLSVVSGFDGIFLNPKSKVTFLRANVDVWAAGPALRGTSKDDNISVVVNASDLELSNWEMDGRNGCTAYDFTTMQLIDCEFANSRFTFDYDKGGITCNGGLADTEEILIQKTVTTTGIEDVEHSILNIDHSSTSYSDGIFDLQGRRVQDKQARPGIYVVNGRKVVVR